MTSLLLNVAAGVLAAFVVAACLDRLRLINWHTAKARYVALYLLSAVWALGMGYEALFDSVELYQLAGVLASLTWLWSTRANWRGGPPEHVISRIDEHEEQHLERRSGQDRRSRV